jgi:DNA-binding winged helix-turn-helix (wHTH) protein
MVDVDRCKCCGQTLPFPADKVVVNLGDNRLWFRGRAVYLTTRQAHLAFVLVRRMPETVAHEAITQFMWGDRSTEWSDTNIKVGITELRRRVAGMGLRIVNTWGRGYRIEAIGKSSKTSTATEATHAQA